MPAAHRSKIGPAPCPADRPPSIGSRPDVETSRRETQDEGRPATLSPEEFRLRFAAELGLASSSLWPGARLREDLDLDSLRLLELTLVLDTLGAVVEGDDLARVDVFAELYELYRERVAMPAADRVAEARPRVADALVGRHTLQRPVTAGDVKYVRALFAVDERWPNAHPFAASEPPPPMLLEHLVVEMASSARIGLLAAYDVDLRNGTACLAAAFEPRVRLRGWPLEALVLFVEHLFRTLPLRKLYAEALTSVSSVVESGLGRFFVEEARFVAHEQVDGRLRDLHVLALFREHWDAVAPRFLSRIRAR